MARLYLYPEEVSVSFVFAPRESFLATMKTKNKPFTVVGHAAKAEGPCWIMSAWLSLCQRSPLFCSASSPLQCLPGTPCTACQAPPPHWSVCVQPLDDKNRLCSFVLLWPLRVSSRVVETAGTAESEPCQDGKLLKAPQQHNCNIHNSNDIQAKGMPIRCTPQTSTPVV